MSSHSNSSSSNSSGDSRSRAEIESEIHDTRSRLNDTLHALEYKLSPQQLANETFDYFRHGGPNDFVSNLGESVKQNPTPFLLTTVGLSWLILSQRNPQTSGATGGSSHTLPTTTREGGHRSTGGASHTASSTASGAASATRRTAGQARDTAGNVASSVRNSGSQLQENSRAAARRTSHKARSAGAQTVSFIEDNPLAAGVIGIAIGAALGSLLPSSRVENEQLGGMRDDLVDKANDVGLEQADKAQAKVEEKSQQAKANAPSDSDRTGVRDDTPSATGPTTSSPATATTGPARPSSTTAPTTPASAHRGGAPAPDPDDRSGKTPSG